MVINIEEQTRVILSQEVNLNIKEDKFKANFSLPDSELKYSKKVKVFKVIPD